MRSLKALLLKDTKDLLRDPRILIPFILSALVLPVIGIVISQGFQESIQAVIARPIESIAMVNLDNGTVSQELISLLETMEYVELRVYNNITEALSQGCEMVIVIPPNFSKSFEEYVKHGGEPPKMVVIQRVESLGIGLEPMRAYSGASTVVGILRFIVASEYNVTSILHAILNPAQTEAVVYLRPRHAYVLASEQLSSMFTLPLIVAPLIVGVVGITVLQIASTSMAVENEVKTLETLLTFPVSRMSILLAKILSSFTVGIIGSLFNVIGFAVYIYIVSQGISGLLTSVQQGISEVDLQLLKSVGIDRVVHPLQLMIPESSVLALLAVSSIIMVFFLAVLGVMIGALSSDVRIASTFIGPLAMPVFVMIYFVSFMDPTQMSSAMRLVLLSIPISQTAFLAKLSLLNLWLPEIGLGLAISIAITIAMLSIASRMLSMETLARIHYRLSMRFRRSRMEV